MAVFLFAGLTPPVHSVIGGSQALSNPYAVALLRDPLATTSGGCSGALVAPQLVFTAAHCLTGSAKGYWLAQPGSDLRDSKTIRIQGSEYFIPNDFSPNTFPYNNDFGVLVLSQPFLSASPIKIATLEQVKEWTSKESAVLHVGYGCTELVDSPPCRVTSQVPNQLETTFLSRIPPQFASLTAGTFSLTKISVEKSICGGDSGSPLLKSEGGNWFYIGAQSSSNGAGCTKSCNEICAASQGLAAMNAALITKAEIYLKQLGVSTSPSPTPSPEASLPTVIASSSDLAKNKLLTITCTKGKVTKKITGTNPKCPVGYRKK